MTTRPRWPRGWLIAYVAIFLVACGSPPVDVQSTVVAAVNATVVALPMPTAQRIEVTSVVTQIATVIVTATPLPATATLRPTPAPTELPTAGKWRVINDTSSFDDSKTVVLYLEAENEITNGFATAVPSLIARCQEKTAEVFVVVGMQPDVEPGNLDGVTVRVRFDDTAAAELNASKSTDNESLFFPKPRDMIAALSNSEQLLVGFTPFNADPVEMMFDVRGFNVVVSDLLAECPLT